MKDNLFSNLNAAENFVNNSFANIRHIHESRACYNYTVTVSYEHKVRVYSWFKWVWERETRYRQEIRFNHEKFNEDLNAAHQQLNQAQNNYNAAVNNIKSEISSAQGQINNFRTLQGEVSSLQNQNNTLASKFSHLGVNSWNAASQVHYVRQQAQGYITQLANTQKNLNELPGQIQKLELNNNNKKAELENLNEQYKEVSFTENRSLQTLKQKLMSLTEGDRAKLAYDSFVKSQNLILKVIENTNFFTEKMAEIAISKYNQAAFDYCLNKGINYDALISANKTLGICIIKSGNPIFINHLFSSKQELKLSIYMACGTNEFAVLETILQHDASALQKFKDIEVCGFGVVQYAIASDNFKLLEFVAEHDIACYKQELLGYPSLFYMALSYNNPEMIRLISEHANLDEELAYLLQKDESDMFKNAINNIELPQEKILSLLKESEGTEKFSPCLLLLLSKVEDMNQLFVESLRSHDDNLIKMILELKQEALDLVLISNLAPEYNQQDLETTLGQIFQEEQIETSSLIGGELAEQIQFNYL